MKKYKISTLDQISWEFDNKLYRIIEGIRNDTMNKPKILQELTDIRIDVRIFIEDFMADIIQNYKPKGDK